MYVEIVLRVFGVFRVKRREREEKEREREMVAPLVCHGHSRPIVDINFRCVSYRHTLRERVCVCDAMIAV